MNNPPDIISYPSLIQAIVGQFAFMQAIVEKNDNNYDAIWSIDLNDVCKKAIIFFEKFLTIDLAIECTELKNPFEHDLKNFLSEWKEIVDVTAIQQNVHTILIAQDL